MKLKDLKKYLNNLPAELDNCEVICQKDSEGNGYSPLCGVDENTIYIPENSYSGNVYSMKWSAEDADIDEKEWNKLLKDKKKRAIVLYPTN
jgi:hypothetical protein